MEKSGEWTAVAQETVQTFLDTKKLAEESGSHSEKLERGICQLRS